MLNVWRSKALMIRSKSLQSTTDCWADTFTASIWYFTAESSSRFWHRLDERKWCRNITEKFWLSHKPRPSKNKNKETTKQQEEEKLRAKSLWGIMRGDKCNVFNLKGKYKGIYINHKLSPSKTDTEFFQTPSLLDKREFSLLEVSETRRFNGGTYLLYQRDSFNNLCCSVESASRAATCHTGTVNT